MTDYYSSSPLPTPAPGTLPYPWITQFDPIYQVTFYVNLETQESTWTLPDLSNASYDPPAPAVDGTRSAPDGMYGGGVSDFNYSSASFPSSSTGGPNTASSGEASSFYASSGTIPQAPGQSTYTDQTPPQSYDANGQPIQGDGERGLGKIIVGGGAMYLAYKLYKDYQKGKLNQQQFKPPNPSDQTPQLHPPHGNYQYVHYPQDHFRPPQRDNNVAPMPNWNQKPTPSGYNGPPPGPYNAGGSSQPYGQHASPYSQQPTLYPDSSPAPYNGGGGAQPYSQPPQYDTSQATLGATQDFSNGFGASTKSAWGDPRY